jgi:hypothetical protein
MAKNAHLIEARFLPATNTKNYRVRLFSHRFPRDSVTEDSDGEKYRDAMEQGAAMLEALGYTVECLGEARHGYFFVVSEFIPLRDAAAKLRKSRKRGEG